MLLVSIIQLARLKGKGKPEINKIILSNRQIMEISADIEHYLKNKRNYWKSALQIDKSSNITNKEQSHLFVFISSKNKDQFFVL